MFEIGDFATYVGLLGIRLMFSESGPKRYPFGCNDIIPFTEITLKFQLAIS